MKNYPSVAAALNSNHNVSHSLKLIAEWEVNRISRSVASSNSDLYSEELFPIESISESNRPQKGVSKIRVGEGVITDSTPTNNEIRYYMPSREDVYKHWVSLARTDSSGNFSTPVNVRLSYFEDNSNTPSLPNANKVVVTLDNGWATPSEFNIVIKTSVATKTIPHTAVAIANDGTISLHLHGSEWQNAPTPSSNLATLQVAEIEYIELQVSKMGPGRNNDGTISTSNNGPTTGGNSRLSVIGITSYVEVDLTGQVISTSDSQELSDDDEYLPLGTVTTNQGSLTLSNIFDLSGETMYGLFSNNNPTSPLSGYAKYQCKFNLSYLVDGVSIPQFEMFAEDWDGISSDMVTIPLRDTTTHLNEVHPLAAVYEGYTSFQIAQRILDSVGFTKWKRDGSSTLDKTIDYFWFTGEENAFELLDKLARATQSAFYVNSLGEIVMKTKEDAFDRARPTAGVLRANTSGSNLANVITISVDSIQGPNTFTVPYATREWSRDPYKDVVTRDEVWAPESSLNLRGCILADDLLANTTSLFFTLSAADAKAFPYSGLVEIEGETIRYIGKEVIPYSSTGAKLAAKVVSSVQEVAALKKAAGRFSSLIKETGRIRIGDDNGSTANYRGLYGSEIALHQVPSNKLEYSWVGPQAFKDSTGKVAAATGGKGTLKFIPQASVARVVGPKKAAHCSVAKINVGADKDAYGARIRFSSKNGYGGIGFHLQSNNSGYYLFFYNVKSKKAGRVELVRLQRSGSNVTRKVLGTGKAVVRNTAYSNVDITVRRSGGDDYISAWIDGKMIVKGVAANTFSPGVVGMVASNGASVDFDYVYAVKRTAKYAAMEELERNSFYDLKSGSYGSNRYFRDFIWDGTKKDRTTKKNSGFFADFGPFVHDIREFDVDFEPSPVKNPAMILSDNRVIVPEFSCTQFGAKFKLVNASRSSVSLQGSNVSALSIVGQTLDETDTGEVKGDIPGLARQQGVREAELSSEFIQSKAAAEEMVEWLKEYWSQDNERASVEIFGNPLIEIGDVLAVDSDLHSLDESRDRFFVTGITTSWDSGIKTQLNLRRV